MAKQSYTVTEKAGLWVAGKRSPGVGKSMMLTEEEARYPLIHGELTPASAASEQTAPKTGKSGKATDASSEGETGA